LLFQPAGPCDVETVAAGVDDVFEPDALAHIRQVAPADDGDRIAFSETGDGGACLLCDSRLPVVVYDRR